MFCFHTILVCSLAARAWEGTKLDPQGRRGALLQGTCSKLLPRSITHPSFSAAQRANYTYQLTAPSFIHTFLKAASKTKHLLTGRARAQ